MSLEIPVPSASDPIEDLADWIELEALRVDDGNASLENLASALRLSGSTEGLAAEGADYGDSVEEPALVAAAIDRGYEESHARAEDALGEIEAREVSCDGQYPFRSARGFVETADDGGSAYLFLLLLSTFGKDAVPFSPSPTKLFEDLCSTASANYIGGIDAGAQFYTFGAPRRPPFASGFAEALAELCESVGEGGPVNRENPKLPDQQDGHLDVVAWRRFPDRKSAKLVAFGQCATGRHWAEKVSELQPREFMKSWLIRPFLVDPIKLFFVPHRIEPRQWDQTAIAAGVVFDRCRLAALLQELPQPLLEQCNSWSDAVLAELQA